MILQKRCDKFKIDKNQILTCADSHAGYDVYFGIYFDQYKKSMLNFAEMLSADKESGFRNFLEEVILFVPKSLFDKNMELLNNVVVEGNLVPVILLKTLAKKLLYNSLRPFSNMIILPDGLLNNNSFYIASNDLIKKINHLWLKRLYYGITNRSKYIDKLVEGNICWAPKTQHLTAACDEILNHIGKAPRKVREKIKGVLRIVGLHALHKMPGQEIKKEALVIDGNILLISQKRLRELGDCNDTSYDVCTPNTKFKILSLEQLEHIKALIQDKQCKKI